MQQVCIWNNATMGLPSLIRQTSLSPIAHLSVPLICQTISANTKCYIYFYPPQNVLQHYFYHVNSCNDYCCVFPRSKLPVGWLLCSSFVMLCAIIMELPGEYTMVSWSGALLVVFFAAASRMHWRAEDFWWRASSDESSSSDDSSFSLREQDKYSSPRWP